MARLIKARMAMEARKFEEKGQELYRSGVQIRQQGARKRLIITTVLEGS
jgi:hypothetical protein